MNQISTPRRLAYAGIGARQTPGWLLPKMTEAAMNLEKMGLILRSGGAKGADAAFEAGVQDKANKEIYLPWAGFNWNNSHRTFVWKDAIALAKKFHPAFHKLTPPVQKLMARNSYQVLGENLDDPAAFILCWTPNGAVTGGTGQALRIAQAYNIHVINLGSTSLDEASEMIMQIIKERQHA